MEDESNIRLAYATHEDIAACCPTETVLAVRVKPSFSFIMLMAIWTSSCEGWCETSSLFLIAILNPHVLWTLPINLSFTPFLKRLLLGPSSRCRDRRLKSGAEENIRFILRFVRQLKSLMTSIFVDGDWTNWGCATGRWWTGLDCCSGKILILAFVSFLFSCQVPPPPAPTEVKEEGSLGVKLEDRKGLEVGGMKREREEDEDEFAKKRQRLEDGEIVPEEEDGFSDSEVEQTLQGAVPGLGHLQGTTFW